MSSPIPSILDACAAVVELRDPPSFRDWVARNIYIAKRAERYDIDRVWPYFGPVSDALRNLSVDVVTVMTGAQIGKTEYMFAEMMYAIACRPGDLLCVYPSVDIATTYIGDRFIPNIAHAPDLVDLYDLKSSKNSAQGIAQKFLNGKTLHGMWSGSKMAGSGNTLPRVFLDERDKHSTGLVGDPTENYLERTATFAPDRFVIQFSTPDVYGGPISEEFRRGLQHEYMLRCPHCTELFLPKFEQFHWPAKTCRICGKTLTRQEAASRRADAPCAKCGSSDIETHSDATLGEYAYHARKTCIYVCDVCGCVVEPIDWPDCVRRGRYVTGTWDDTFDMFTPHPPERWDGVASRMSFHIPGIVSPFKSLGIVAEQFVFCLGDPNKIKAWRQNNWGLPWIDRKNSVTRKALASLIDPDLPVGRLPDDAIALVGAIDVQDYSVWVELVAIRPGYRKHVVYAANIHGHAGHDDVSKGSFLVALEHASKMIWPETSPWKKRDGSAFVPNVCIDARDPDHQQSVYEFCRRHPYAKPSYGMSGHQMGTSYEPHWKYLDQPGLQELRLYHHAERDRVLSELRVQPGVEGSWTVAAGLPDDWFRHHTAWQYIQSEDRATKQETVKLQQMRKDDHLLDCSIVSGALARLTVWSRGQTIADIDETARRVHEHNAQVAAARHSRTPSPGRPLRRPRGIM